METIQIELDKQRTLKYTWWSFREIEHKLGLSSLEELGNVETANFNNMTTLLWAGLIHEDRTLRLEDVGHMVDGTNFNEVLDAIGKAMALAMPATENGGNPTTAGLTGSELKNSPTAR